MLNKDDSKKSAIMVAIRCGEPDENILEVFHITSGTLKAIKTEYEMIKTQLEEMKAVSEIAGWLQCSEEFIEKVKHIIEADEETLMDEAAPEQPEEPEKPKKKKGGKDAKDVDKHLKKTGEEQTAAVLVDDAGDIAKGVAIQRQDIGKFVMEMMGTIAMQFGYKDIKEFLEVEVFAFWLKYQGRMNELETQVGELVVVNEKLQEALEMDMIGLYIVKKLDGLIYLMANAENFEPSKLPQTLAEYKKVLVADPVFLRQVYDAIHSIPKREVEAYAT